MVLVVSIIALICSWACPVWALIEFILYLVKDKEFNWLSLWLFFLSSVYLIILSIVDIKSTEDKPVKKVSAFQARLEQMAKQRDKLTNK